MDASAIATALAEGGAEEREAAYTAIEGATHGQQGRLEFATACVRPVVASILCAPASRIAVAEWRRAFALLFEMCKLDMVVLGGEVLRKDDQGNMLYTNIFTTADTAFAAMIRKAPSEWTRDDAVTAAWSAVLEPTWWVVGGDAVFAEAGITFDEWFYRLIEAFPWFTPDPIDKFAPLALLCLELIRTSAETDEQQPEGVIVGGWRLLSNLAATNPPVARLLWDNGFLDLARSSLQQYNPMERVMRTHLIPSAIFNAWTDIIRHIGAEAVQPLLDAGAVEIAISTLTAYQMLGKPEEASALAVAWGACGLLDILLGSLQAKPIVQKLRSAGVDAFRYVLDNPLVVVSGYGAETGVSATRIAAQVWGRDDDGGGLTFKQQDVDQILYFADHRGPAAALFPMTEGHGLSILSLCVSDTHKELLLASSGGCIALLVDSLLLDVEHPRQENAALTGVTDWEAAKAPVQRDFAEAIAQLALFEPGRAALLRDPTVAEALQQVAAEGWTEEARLSAEAALAALSDRQPDVEHRDEGQQRHIMLSYQWGVQEVVKRIVNELQANGYRTWFDLDNMKGSTVDAMSDAVDNAEVMLSCISLAYKESANCRLEAQYGHQVEVEMLPLMMEKGFSPTGWLGLLVGTKLYFNFHPAAVETEDLFLQQIEQVVRSLGERGKPKVGGGRVSEGVPPAVAVQSMEPSPAPAPVRARTAAPAPAPAPAPATPPRSQQPYTPSVHSVTTAGRSSTAALDSANSSSSSSSSVAQHGALVPSSQAAALAAAAPGAGITLESMAALLEKQQDRMEERMEKQNEKIERLRQETEALRAGRLREQQLVALQARIDGLVAATLLSDDERDAIEDAMADAAEGGDEAGFAAQMAALAEKFRSDRALARQLRRKYCR